MGRTNLEKFYKRRAHHHIFFGLVMAAQEFQRPLTEAIAAYRRRTGDEKTHNDSLYKMAGEMTHEFKGAAVEAQNG